LNVLANDGLHPDAVRLLEEQGCQIELGKRNPDSLKQVIGDYHAMIVRSATQVTKDVLEAGAKGKLVVVVRAGVGYDNIDVEAAAKQGILVKNAINGNTNGVVEMAMGYIFALSRNLVGANQRLREGVWEKKRFAGTELAHKTLGIMGCGRIGQRLGDMASLLGMKVVGYDKYLHPERLPETSIEFLDKEQVLRTADFLTIHTGSTELVVDAHELALMKKRAYLINTSRPGNVDYGALRIALTEGKLAGAAIDVHSYEPGESQPFVTELGGLENVILTPHIAGSTQEAERRTGLEAAETTLDTVNGNFSNAVNTSNGTSIQEPKTYSLAVVHDYVVRAFGQIDDVIGTHGINIRGHPSRRLGNGTNDGPALTVYRLDQEPGPGLFSSLLKLDIVKRVTPIY
jgi:D-3-phosphoglycerate dehydrogenase